MANFKIRKFFACLGKYPWSPTALQPWHRSTRFVGQNPPKRILLRQGYGGYPHSSPPSQAGLSPLRGAPKWARYVIRVGSVEELVTKLKAAATRHGVRYALSGPGGASLVFSYLTPTMVHFYVDILKQEFLEELKVDPVPSEGNLLIRVVEQENEFIGSRQVKNVYVVSDLQLYLDLWAMGGRGQEAAEELRREHLHF